jgi:hypothetical protein
LEVIMVRSVIAITALFSCLALAPVSAVSQETVAPGNSAPEHDARGIPVISDPATAPAGTNQPAPTGRAVPAPNQAAAFAAQLSTGEKPPCSRTITDNCMQTYERGMGLCPNPDYPNDPDCPRRQSRPR